ncbi:MAG: GldL-related protein [Methanococcaceae archaeon]
MKKLTTRFMDILIGVSAGIVAIGAFFRIQHYPYGNFMLMAGLLLTILLSAIEIQRLRQIIKENGYKE